MRSRSLAGIIAASLALAIAAPAASAAPPDKLQIPLTIQFPDFERGLVGFLNTTRTDYCTQSVVDFEQFFIDLEEWESGDMQDPPPEFPGEPEFPDGEKLVNIQEKVTGRGAIVGHARGSDLVAELWPMVGNPPGAGPCTDSDGSATPWTGKGSFRGNDNDLDVSESRGNAFGERISMRVSRNGHHGRYEMRFHVNDRCYMPDDGPPRCLVESTRFIRVD
jgi:hypothetical protein